MEVGSCGVIWRPSSGGVPGEDGRRYWQQPRNQPLPQEAGGLGAKLGALANSLPASCKSKNRDEGACEYKYTTQTRAYTYFSKLKFLNLLAFAGVGLGLDPCLFSWSDRFLFGPAPSTIRRRKAGASCLQGVVFLLFFFVPLCVSCFLVRSYDL